MNEAILPLVGVVIGGMLASGTTLWVERVRAHREARAAARLVHRELSFLAELLDLALRSGRPDVLAEGLPRVVWDEQAPMLARTLNTSAWNALLAAYAVVPALEGSWSGPTRRRTVLVDSERMVIEESKRRADAALAALERVTGVTVKDEARLLTFLTPVRPSDET